MITPDIEKELIKFAKKCYCVKLNIPFVEELKTILIARGIEFCKSKQIHYNKSVGKEMEFYSTILKNYILLQSAGLLSYLDESKRSHQNQVELNGEYWERILKQAKRDHLLNELLSTACILQNRV